jgi:hypothetical protein
MYEIGGGCANGLSPYCITALSAAAPLTWKKHSCCMGGDNSLSI